MIVAVSNQKGGVNKTTLTFNLGYLLAEQGKRTLVIDADPQGSLTTAFNTDNRKKNIYSVLLEQESLEKTVLEVEDNLYLLPGGIELANFEVNVATKRGRENCFKEMLGHKIVEQYIKIAREVLNDGK